MAFINFLVEGRIDEAVAIKLASSAGFEPGTCFGKKGMSYIKKKITGFNLSAQGSLFFALVDLMDTSLTCPAEVLSQWLPHRNPNMMFRVVVKEIESWLLADRQGIAEFLHVNSAFIPHAVETLDDPKQTLIQIARRSRRKFIRETLAPAAGTTAREGILYNDEMTRFVQDHWNTEEARLNSPSLDQCIIRLNELKGKQ